MDLYNSSGSNDHRDAGHSTSQNAVEQGTTSNGPIGQQQTNTQPNESQQQILSNTNHKTENKTTSNGTNDQQQTVPKSDQFQEQDLCDKMQILHMHSIQFVNCFKLFHPEITEDEKRKMKRISELDTLRGQIKALEEENKKFQDELSTKEIKILELSGDIERRPERSKSGYPTDHRDKGRPPRPKSAFHIDNRFQRYSESIGVDTGYIRYAKGRWQYDDDTELDWVLSRLICVKQNSTLLVSEPLTKEYSREEMQMKIDEQQSDIDTLTTQKLQKKEECVRLCKEVDVLKENLKQYENVITSLKEEKISNEKTILRLKDEKNELLNRLSKIASDQLTYENTDITDLSDDTRPSKLSEMMSELYDNQWTRAFEELKTNGFEDERAIDILLKIVMETNQVCKAMTVSHYQKLREACTGFEYSSSADAEYKEQIKIFKTGKISIEMTQDIKRIWRESSKKVMKKVIPIIEGNVAKKFDIPLLQMAQTPLYMKECAKLCWMMNIQEKPMHLDINVPERDGHKSFDTEKFRSYTKTGQHVAFVVWPVLYLFEGGSLLKKGVAQGVKVETGASGQEHSSVPRS